MKTIFALALTLLLLPAAVSAATLAVGDPLPELTLQDQHDQTQRLDAAARKLIFSAERDASSLVEAALAEQTADTLAAAGIRYIADISAMPSMITKLVALPQLRKRPYPILLGRDAEQTAMLPREPGKVTLIEIADGAIEQVRFFGDGQSLRDALGLRP